MPLPQPPAKILTALRRGMAIPAHPLALTPEHKLDEKHQRALTRYYCAAGAGGLAVAVHTTQFEIREPQFAMLEPVLALAAEEARRFDAANNRQTMLISGICGNTKQAVAEAQTAARLGYHSGLLSLAAMKNAADDALIAHCKAVAEIIPLFGFYLQPAVGGRILGYSFWRRFAEIENVIGIKMAPFNRYQTIDVVRAVAESGRANEIALYTGNDDHILLDLLTPYCFPVNGETICLRIVGGLLGQWAVWTERAVAMLAEAHKVADSGAPVSPELLAKAIRLTDANAAVFDVAHNYAGCIAGINEVLRQQGILANRCCLNPKEDLSSGQTEEIARVRAAYPELIDDTFVSAHLQEWLS